MLAVSRKQMLSTFRQFRRTGLDTLSKAVRPARNFADTSTTSDAPLRQPSSTPPDNPTDRPADFHRFADLYIGGLWNKLESNLRQQEGEAYDFDVNFTRGCLKMKMPDGEELEVCKVPQQRKLKVISNMHDIYGGGEEHCHVEFDLAQETGGFEKDGQTLHEYLEDSFAKHFKTQMDLKPDLPTLYGADPT